MVKFRDVLVELRNGSQVWVIYVGGRYVTALGADVSGQVVRELELIKL